MAAASNKGPLCYDVASNHFLWAEKVLALQEFLSEILNDDSIKSGDISEDKLHKMLSFKTKDCTVKLYSTTRKVVIQGSGSASLTKTLSDIILESDDSDVSSTDAVDNNGDQTCQTQEPKADQDRSYGASGTNLSINTDSPHFCECSKIKFDIGNVQEEIKIMKKNISLLLKSSGKPMQITIVDENEPDLNLNLNLNEKLLRDENICLKSQLEDLKSSVNLLKHTIVTLETEKISLINSLRILQQEANEDHQTGTSNQPERDPPSVTTHQQSVAPQVHRNNNKRQKNKNKNGQRSKETVSPPSQPVSAAADKSQPVQAAAGTSQPTERREKNVTILGDSVIKGVKWWKLRKEHTKVNMKMFPGATVEDMESYMLPTVRKDPDVIVLHIGTNDLPNNTARQVAESVVNLADNIAQNSSAKPTISSLILRTDDAVLSDKVTKCNKILKTFTSNRGWGFIDNSRIGSSMLNAGGLHLNDKGSSALAKNIRDHIHNSN